MFKQLVHTFAEMWRYNIYIYVYSTSTYRYIHVYIYIHIKHIKHTCLCIYIDTYQTYETHMSIYIYIYIPIDHYIYKYMTHHSSLWANVHITMENHNAIYW